MPFTASYSALAGDVSPQLSFASRPTTHWTSARSSAVLSVLSIHLQVGETTLQSASSSSASYRTNPSSLRVKIQHNAGRDDAQQEGVTHLATISWSSGSRNCLNTLMILARKGEMVTIAAKRSAARFSWRVFISRSGALRSNLLKPTIRLPILFIIRPELGLLPLSFRESPEGPSYMLRNECLVLAILAKELERLAFAFTAPGVETLVPLLPLMTILPSLPLLISGTSGALSGLPPNPEAWFALALLLGGAFGAALICPEVLEPALKLASSNTPGIAGALEADAIAGCFIDNSANFVDEENEICFSHTQLLCTLSKATSPGRGDVDSRTLTSFVGVAALPASALPELPDSVVPGMRFRS